MALDSVISKVLKISGRDDLVKQDGTTDNGIVWYINEGQRYLDRRVDIPLQRRLFNIAKDTINQEIDLVRSIVDVWIANSDGRWQLEKKDLSWLRDTYSKVKSGLTSARPLYWTLSISTLHPDNQDNSFDSDIYDVDAVVPGPSDETTTVYKYGRVKLLWYPPADAIYTMNVFGNFRSKTLSNSYDNSWWTEEAESILVHAAMMQLEGAYRNRTGVRDWRELIDDALVGIDHESVSKEIVQRIRLKGNLTADSSTG